MSYRGAQNTLSYASRPVKMLCVGAGCDAGKSLASPAAVVLLVLQLVYDASCGKPFRKRLELGAGPVQWPSIALRSPVLWGYMHARPAAD